MFVCLDCLTHALCDKLVALAKQSLTPSATESARRESRSGHRHRRTFGWDQHPACAQLAERARVLTNIDASTTHEFEVPQVARYLKGQYYKAHLDSTDDELGPRISSRRSTRGISRACTILIYLNEVKAGGATHFPYLRLAVRPRKGAALVFFQSRLDGRVDQLTLHEALAADDTKWVCQLWVQKVRAEAAAVT